MSSFRPLGQFIQFFLDNGQVNAGGSVTFYETDLTTLKNTYSNPGLTVLNANPVALDAAGRPATDIWGSGVYGAVLKDASGTTIQTLNNIQSGADPGFSIPSLVNGDFLSNDGSNLLWQPVFQVPDPTGSAGDILVTDGTLAFWRSLSAAGVPSGGKIVVTTAKTTIADTTTTTTSLMIQQGSGTCPASGGHTTTGSVSFPTAFNATPQVYVQCNGGGVTPDGFFPIACTSGISTTGFNIGINVNEGGSSGGANITSTVNFQWLAIGTVTTP